MMAESSIKVLSTRPIDAQVLQEAISHNIQIDVMSFINTEFFNDNTTTSRISNLLKEEINAVFTSMTAVEAVSKHIIEKPCWSIYCIGNTTKKLVESTFSSKNIKATADNANELAMKIISDAPGKVTFFCGDKRRNELPLLLKNARIEVDELVVYKTNREEHTLLKEYDAILFFSPSAVTSFFSKNRTPSKTRIFVIGTTTAEAVGTFTQNPLIIARSPGKSNLVRDMIEYFSSKKNITCKD